VIASLGHGDGYIIARRRYQRIPGVTGRKVIACAK
jgi:hypothetical protein